jgi:hypothetical protein
MTEKEETDRIHLTLPKRWIDVLNILSRDQTQRSTTMQLILQDYIYARKDRLMEEGMWPKIQAALRGSAVDNDIVEMIAYIDDYVKDQPQNKELIQYWKAIKATQSDEKIRTLYQKIVKKINELESRLDSII